MNLKSIITLSLVFTLVGGGLLGLSHFASGAAWVLLPLGGLILVVAAVSQIGLLASLRLAFDGFQSWVAVDDARDLREAPRVVRPLGDLPDVLLDRVKRWVANSAQQDAVATKLRAEAYAIKQRYELTQRLFDSLSDGIVLFDESRATAMTNFAARVFLEVDAEKVIDRGLAAIANVPLRQALQRALVSGGESRTARDIDCSDQTRRLVLQIKFMEVKLDGTSDAESIAMVIRDVTRERELNRMKSDFASSVSHELKTPLSSMRAFLEMILDGDISGEEERKRHLQVVLDETERLTQLIQNVLNLSRLESGVTRMEREDIAVEKLVDHVRQVVTPLADARHQSVLFQVSKFIPRVMGDRTLLEQALMNLVSNAIKYTPEGGAITVKAGLAGSMVEISVSDNGVGIPAKALDRIFEKFSRIENHAGLKATGTGLGLPLAKFVVEAHGGQIGVTSEEGVGSRFSLLLPSRRANESTESRLVGLEGMSG